MNKILIWDLPARFFHWAFAVTLTLAFILGLTGEHGGQFFQYHKLLGLVAVFLLVCRIILGLVGSRPLRWTSFPLRPGEIWGYFTGILAGRHQSYPGHNPGAALAALAMFILVPLVVFTGLFRGGEALEDLHAVLAYTLCGVVAAHILGLIVHTIRHRENIGAAMLTGRKMGPPEAALPSAHFGWGLVLAVAVAAWVWLLFGNYNPRNGTVRLPVIGTIVDLGKGESGSREHDDD